MAALTAGVLLARGRRRALMRAGLGVAATMLGLAAALAVVRALYLDAVPAAATPPDRRHATADRAVHPVPAQ